MKEVLKSFFAGRGYFSAITTMPEFEIHFLPGSGNVEVVMIIDYQKEIYLSVEVYNSVKDKFIQSFKERGFTNVHMMTLVLCNDLDKMESVFGEDRFCWYIDAEEKSISVPNGHVEDFYGLKRNLEDFLSVPFLDVKEDCAENLQKKTSVNLKEVSFINIIIVATNILIFILCAFIPDVLYNKGAFSFFLIEETKGYYRFLTSIFMHVDIDHLFSNMIVLFFLGNMVEKKLGHIKYVILYFVSAILGNVASAVYEIYIGQMYTTVGASGAVFGIIGAVLLLVVLEGGKWETITLPRMLIMLSYSIYTGFVMENVNNAAHLGGFLSGLLVMGVFWIICMLRKKEGGIS